MFPSFSSQFWYWLIFHTHVLKKNKKKQPLNRLKGSSGSTVKAAGRCAQPCPRLCQCLSHLHLGRTGSVLCPGTLPEKLLWMNSPRWPSSLHAVTSPRSPASSLVTHSAPGDRYYILYHSLCTSSRGTRLLARSRTHTHMHTHASVHVGGGRRQKEWLNTKTGLGQTIIPSRLSSYLTPPPPSLTNTDIP